MKRFLVVLASITFIIGFAAFLEQLTAMSPEIPPRGQDRGFRLTTHTTEQIAGVLNEILSRRV